MAVAASMTALEAFVSNEAELRQVFEGKSTERKKDVMRAQHKKNTFLNELVWIKLLDEAGYLVEEWKLVRKRIDSRKIHALIGRTSRPDVEVDFFYDSTGVPIWMEDLLLKGQKSPNFYTIVPQVKRFPEDIRDNLHYEGQASFTIRQVPCRSKDEKTLVTDEALRVWMLYAINEEDPHCKPLAAKIPPVEDIIKQIDKKIKGVSKMKFFDEDGKPMDDEKAELEREAIYESFGADRLVAEKRLTKYQNNLDAHRIWRRSIGIDFTLEETDANTDAATWRLRFYGHKDALEMEDLLIKKDNWSGIRLACGAPAQKDVFQGAKIPPYAIRGPLPDGTNPMLPDYSDLAVNVAGARFKRIPHGVGTIKALDRKDTTIRDDHFGVYYGRFELGKKTGISFEMDDVSVYSGKFLNNYRWGTGRLDYGDGTTLVGNFGCTTLSTNKVSLLFDNPYMNGEPHGNMEILFGDGAIYKGEMRDGKINGEGTYQSALGEVIIGTFRNGTLHGKDCYRKNHCGEQFKGEFDMGELNGYGLYQNARGDTYDGYWDHDLRHGRGVAGYHKLGKYRGYFVNGTRNGKGELEYMPRPKVKQKKKKKNQPEESGGDKGGAAVVGDAGAAAEETALPALTSEFMRVFQGFFMSDQIANGGTVMDLDTQTPTVISRRDKRKLQPIQYVFDANSRNVKKLNRLVEKFNDMEMYIRKEVSAKKFKIFRQQRHYTKKSMYATDTWGGFPKSELDNRAIVRERRMVKQQETVLRPKLTLVPHLQNIDTHSMTHLTAVYSSIKPDASDGRTDGVNTMFVKAAVSDYEEIVERQRYLKYDEIWKRAESHFIDKKRAAKAASMGGGEDN